MNDVRIAVVLSAGGLRGAAHVGVLSRIVGDGVPIHAIVGVSAGAVVAAYYASVGLGIDDLIGDAARFRGRHLLMHSVHVHVADRIAMDLTRWCGVIPQRLQQLETATFDRLHHGVGRLGIVCHDVRTARPQYFATESNRGVSLNDAVRASASIPRLFPPIAVTCDGTVLDLTDGGISDAVPLAFARSAAVGATHVIVSDCRWFGRVPRTDPTTVWIRPRMIGAGTLWSPRHGLSSVVQRGAAAVSDAALDRIRSWTTRQRETTCAETNRNSTSAFTTFAFPSEWAPAPGMADGRNRTNASWLLTAKAPRPRTDNR
jgi:predicted acylesterase/phospholipase RssA